MGVPPGDELLLLGVGELAAHDGVEGGHLLVLLLLDGGRGLLRLDLAQQALEQLLLLAVEVRGLGGALAVLQGKK